MTGVNTLTKNPHLLLDGDILAYRAAAAAEKTKYMVLSREPDFFDTAKEAKAYAESSGNEVWSRKEVKEFAVCGAIIHQVWDGLVEQFDFKTYSIWLSGERNFRDLIWKTKKYKGNRTSERPKHFGEAREYLSEHFLAEVATGEADDAIVAEHFLRGNDSVIVSNDKDLDQAWGWHYDWVKKGLYFVNQRDADLFLFQQILSGDATDNIPGLPGWGPAKAKKWLEGTESKTGAIERVRQAYEEGGFDNDYFAEQAELVYIRRDGRSFKEYFGDAETK